MTATSGLRPIMGKGNKPYAKASWEPVGVSDARAYSAGRGRNSVSERALSPSGRHMGATRALLADIPVRGVKQATISQIKRNAQAKKGFA